LLTHVGRDRHRDRDGDLWVLTKTGWKKRKPPREGGPLRSRVHRQWVCDLGCGISGCHERPIHAHHHRSAATAGTAVKPGDEWVVNLCWKHHAEGHNGGWKTFERRNGVDLADHAMWLAAQSPDPRIKQSAKKIIANKY
jgi:hypothetical protein